MAITKDRKIQIIEKIKERSKKSVGIYFMNYQGLSVFDQQELRIKLAEIHADYFVAKNTLIGRALSTETSSIPTLDQSTAVLFAYDDEILPLKTVVEFAKTHEQLQLKGGWLNNNFHTASEVQTLASLPSKSELQAKLVSAFARPITGMIGSMNAPLSGFLNVLRQLSANQLEFSQ